MESLPVEELVRAAGGRLFRGPAPGPALGLATDSRRLRRGELFLALRGPRYDGHDFARQALARGACGVLLDAGRAGLAAQLAAAMDRGELPAAALALVDDGLRALWNVAGWYRQRFSPLCVAVTGSVGKTTTKDLTAAVLGSTLRTVKAKASYNNELGVPLTLLELDGSVEALVVEVAMRGPGEIRALAGLARPRIGVVTNVGPVHLERLGSLEAIAAAKGELLEALPPDGTAVLNGDDARVRELPTRARTLFFGSDSRAAVRARDVRVLGEEGLAFTLEWTRWEGSPPGEVAVRFPLPGRHNVANALAAAAVGRAAGLSLEAVATGLAAAAGQRSPGRLELQKGAGGITVINDAHNASPASVHAALEFLAGYPGRRVAVLGDMLELGPLSEEAHLEVGRRAVAAGVDFLVAVGEHARAIQQGAEAEGGFSGGSAWAADADAAARILRETVRPGDVVLVKASRRLGLERVADALRRGAPGEEAAR